MAAFEANQYADVDQAFAVDRLNDILQSVEADDRTQALVEAQNVNPVVRLRYNDHGPKHIATVLERAIALYDLLVQADVSFNGATDHGLDEADEPVIIALGAIYHDIGNVVHRHRHTAYSIGLARERIQSVLETRYDPATATTITGEVLHTIACHHSEETPLTREAGVVRVADALDMERGRSRKPYEQGGRGINTISSRAIKSVTLKAGDERPVDIEIEMTSAAGIYQVDELLHSKVDGSLLEDHVRIVAVMSEAEDEDRLIERFEL